MNKMGIDPGKVNLGWAVLKEDGTCLTGVVNPKTTGFLPTVESLALIATENEVDLFCIERYVGYEGVHNPASEFILMLIGALIHRLNGESNIILPRATDWKTSLVKSLFLQGFRNPSTKLDKKFSFAAAEFITGKKPETDHEADAVCLAYFSNMDIAGKYSLKF